MDELKYFINLTISKFYQHWSKRIPKQFILRKFVLFSSFFKNIWRYLTKIAYPNVLRNKNSLYANFGKGYFFH